MTTAIDWSQYHEAETIGSDEDECLGCAFRTELESCANAFETAPAVFGGDCMTRNVIYVQLNKD